MQFFITFLEGIITFISPCLLPMLPIYVSYFAGGKEERSAKKTLKNSLSFVLGFTTVFVCLGALAGSFGRFLQQYKLAVNIVTGLTVIFFGLNFLGVFKLNIFKGIKNPFAKKDLGFFSSLLFGVVFSVGWTPCVGAFLGSALALASQQGHVFEGVLLLLCYSAGLGIPFVLSAVLIDKLRGAFGWIKSHYNVINTVCGIILCIIGALMMTGFIDRILYMLN
jgi:cytochrome c-type biogenesis protein